MEEESEEKEEADEEEATNGLSKAYTTEYFLGLSCKSGSFKIMYLIIAASVEGPY